MKKIFVLFISFISRNLMSIRKSYALFTLNKMKKLHLIFLPIGILAVVVSIAVLVVYQKTNSLEANRYFNLGNEAALRNDLDEAIEYYTKAINIKPKFTESYFNRAKTYLVKGEMDKVLEDYTIVIKLDPKSAEAYSLLGEVYYFRGEYDKAIDYYSRALQLKPELTKNYTDRGNAYLFNGEYDLAIEDYNKRLAIDPDDATTLFNRSLAYDVKGEYSLALIDSSSALELSPENRKIRNFHAFIYLHLKQYEKAIADFNELIRSSPDFALSYLNRGITYLYLKDYNNAIEDFTKSISLDPSLSSAYFYRGIIYDEVKYNSTLAQKDYECYLSAAKQDFNIRELIQAVADLSEFIYNSNYNIYKDLSFQILPKMQEEDMIGETMRRALAMAIDRIENIRSSGARGPQFMLENLYLYYAGVDYEIFFDNYKKAFEYSEALRSRGFLDQMGTEAALHLDSLDPSDVLRVRNLLKEIDKCMNILNSYREKTVEADKRFVSAGQRLEKAEKQLAELEEKITQQEPRYAKLRKPSIISADKAVAFCGEDRVILEYVLWDGNLTKDLSIDSYCLVISKDGINAVKLDPQYNYTEMTNRLRQKIFNEDEPSFEYERKSLYNALIQPVLNKIPANVKEILIVPDGNLAYLPFDILRDSKGKDFGEKYSITISPSISVSALAAGSGVSQEPIIAFGGAWYNKKKKNTDRSYEITIPPENSEDLNNSDIKTAGAYYSKRKFAWSNLPGTELEVKGLGEISANSKIFLGKNVTEAKVKELSRRGDLAKYPVIHFACHGYFNSDAPILSGLVMSEVSGRLPRNSEDGYLTVPEMAGLNLNAHIVVLSACETGRGEIIRGDGMIGLTRSLLVAGARSVGVSLWSISDEPTVDFMLSVYNKALREGKSFRTAYFETKQQSRKSIFWHHPRYWAGFVLYE